MSRAEFSAQIPFFLQNFLGQPASSIPKGGQWVLVFEGPFVPDGAIPQTGSLLTDETRPQNPSLDRILPIRAIAKAIDYEPRAWRIDDAIKATLHTDYQEKKGCMFVQAVQIPGESTVANPEGLQQSGYIRSYVGGGRDAFPTISVSFLETNISFVDNVMRPWVIATSHLGMVARQGPENYRCNFSVYKLGVISQEANPYVAIKYTFFGACPISVTGEEYNYTQTNSPINREAIFTYHYYSIETDPTNLAISQQKLSIERQQSVLRSQNQELAKVLITTQQDIQKAGTNSLQRAQLLQRVATIQANINRNNNQISTLQDQIAFIRSNI
jgi:hypothetical protein